MLELIRKYRTAFSVIFLASAFALVISMFSRGGGGMGGSHLSTGVVAKVEGREIQTGELIQAFNRQWEQSERMLSERMKGQDSDPETRKLMENLLRAQVTPERVLQELVQRRFFAVTADKMGLVTPPGAVRDAIENIDAFHDKQGRFDPLKYRELVPQPAAFERDLRVDAQMNAMRETFMWGLGTVSPGEKVEMDALRTRRTFEALKIVPKDFPEPASVSAEEVKAFLADANAQARVQAYYDRHFREYNSEESVHAKHILIKDDAGGLAKAKDILASIQSGKTTWDAAAKANSADASNKNKGGDLGFFGRGQMDPAFEQAAFALKTPKDITAEPVKSSFGYHLIQLVERKEASKKSLDQVRAEIAPKALLEQRRAEKAQAWARGWLATGKVPSDKDLKHYGLSWSKIPAWSPMEENFGNMGTAADTQLGEIISLNAQKPLLSQPLMEGETLTIVRFTGVEKDKEEMAGVNEAAINKADMGFQTFLQNRYDALEKKKKIVRSEKELGKLKALMKEPS